MKIFLGLFLLFIVIFIFCTCRIAHDADELSDKYFDK